MKRVLLIKLTSLGDLIHALPAISDASAAFPGIVFDWVVDESFHEVALWHPAVQRIYKTNHRVWGKKLLYPSTLKSISSLIQTVRATEYDLIIDGQGNFKSALLSLFVQGTRAGFDRHSVREWIAHLAYQKHYAVSKKGHAIHRLRQLFASACGYALPLSAPDFQVQRDKFLKPGCELPKDYLVFIHNASWKTKLWPEEHWLELIKKCLMDGFNILLPWGNAQERERANRLAIDPRVQVLPKLSLSEIGYIIERARACVAMDTGLLHLISALAVPAVSLYGSTDVRLIGACGPTQSQLTSTLACAPCKKRKCRFSDTENPCLKEITPDRVYKELLRQASLRYL